MTLFLARYGEIALKSDSVRKHFERILKRNLLDPVKAAGIECFVQIQRGRIYINCDDRDAAALSDIMSRTFGIVSFSRAVETSSDPDDIAATCASALSTAIAKTAGRKAPGEPVLFRITASRTGTHRYSSMELAARIGEKMLEHPDFNGRLKVELKQPEVNISIEVRDNRAHVFENSTPGPCGMPVGSQGRVLAHIEGEADAAVAYLLLKRGCTVHCLLSPGLDDAPAVASFFRKWGLGTKRFPIEKAPDDATLLQALAVHASEKGCSAIGLGWDAERIAASSTMLGSLPVPAFFPATFIEAGLVPSFL